MRQTSKNHASRVRLPPELAEPMYIIARKQGYKREHIHRFLYAFLKLGYPEAMTRLANVDTTWLHGEIGGE